MKKILPLVVILLISLVSKAQLVHSEKCGSSHAQEELLKNNPELKQVFELNEQKIQALINKRKSQKTGPDVVYTIPLVIHIVHKGEAVGVGSNISDAQINSGITQINNAFRNTNGLGQDIKIQFQLAVKDANCAATTGIVRVDGSVLAGYSQYGVKRQTSNGCTDAQLKALSIWSNSDYVNIWLVTEIDDNNGGGGIQGYATFPGNAASVDGAVIMNTAWGDQGTVNSWNNKGTTGIHEIGHFFNLYHTFEGDEDPVTFARRCPPTSNGCGNDAGDCCDDTAPHQRSSSNCPTGATNSCTGLLNDNTIKNYMDYSNDVCQTMFSANQKTRMRAALETTRASLLYSNALNATAPAFSITAATCTGTTTSPHSGAGIRRIQIVDKLDVSSGSALTDAGYFNKANSCQSAGILSTNTTYKLKVTVQSVNGHQVKGWIDYNNNGSFEAGEEIFSKSSILGSSPTDSVNFTVPANATTNAYLRMRFLTNFSTNYGTAALSTACDNVSAGEREDYVLFINSSAVAPVANFTANKTTVCVGENVTFTDASTNTPTSWSWTMTGASSASSTSQNPTVTYATAGTYTVTLAATNAGGTSPTETKTNYITVVALPTVSVNNANICTGAPAATFTATTNAVSPTYVWSVNGTGTAATTSGTAAGNYTVVVTGSNTCSNTATGVLTVNALPTVSVNNATICSGAPAATFTATTNAVSPTYVWSVNGTGTAATTSGTSAGNYTVVVTGSNTCSNTATGVLTVNARPTLNLGADKTICSGSSVLLDAGNAGSTFSWSPSGSTQTLLATTAGMYIANVTNANGCTRSDTVIVTVNALPTVSVNNATICTGAPAATFTAITNAVSPTYVWSVNGTGTAATTSGTAAGNYTVVVTGSNTCSNSATGVLTVNALPTVSVNNATICTGAPAATFTATTNAVSPTYVWSVNGTGTAATTSGTSAGNYTVVVTGSNTCSNTATGVLTVNARPTLNLGADKTICSGSSVLLDAGNAGSTFSWSPSGSTQTLLATTAGMYIADVTNANGCRRSDTVIVTVNALPTVSVNNATICTGAPAATFTATTNAVSPTYVWSVNGTGTAATTSGTAAGNYTVVVTGSNTCSNSATGVLTVNALPTVSVNNATICAGAPAATFTATTNAVSPTYVWSVNGTGTAATTSGTAAGNYTVVVTGSNTCSNTATGVLTVNPLPTVTANSNFPTTYIVNEGNIALTFGQPSGGVYSGTGVSGGNFNTTTAGVGTHAILYTYADGNGCSNSVSKNLQVDVFTSVARLKSGITVSPNPFNEVLNIRLTENTTDLSYELSDSQGKTVTVGRINSDTESINTSSLIPGIYFLRIQGVKDQSVYKVVKY